MMHDRQSASTTVTHSRGRSLVLLRIGLLALVLVASAILTFWLTLLPTRVFSLVVGTGESGDLSYLRGVYQSEHTGTYTYRWARGDAQVILPSGQIGSSSSILSIEMHAVSQPTHAPLPFVMHVGAQTLGFAVPEAKRLYRLLIPPSVAVAGSVTLDFNSTALTPAGDSRLLAVALHRIGVRPLATAATPAIMLVLIELAAVAAVAILLWANRAAPRWVGTGVVIGVLLFGALNLSARAWVVLGAWPLAGVGAALAVVSLAVQRILPLAATSEARFVRRLWLITLAGAGLRFLGVAMPGFELHDLDIQAKLFTYVVNGEIYLSVTSQEFAGGRTFYPPGPYLLILPLLLIKPTLSFVLNSGVALFDACAVPLLAMVARALGQGRRAALLAAALLAVLPMEFTIIWWGFFTNIGGQLLFLLAVWLLLRYVSAPTRSALALCFVALSLLLVSHVGVLLLAGCTLALTIGFSWLRPRLSAHVWRRLIIVSIGSGAFFLVSYFSVVLAPMLASAHTVLMGDNRLLSEQLATGRAYIVRILPVALWRGMGLLPFLALVPGMPLLWRGATRPLGRALLLGALIAPLLFCVVDLLILAQVRYIYFLGPLCALALATTLDQLGRCRAGRLVALLVLLIIAWLGLSLWQSTFVIGIKPSLIPLTH